MVDLWLHEGYIEEGSNIKLYFHIIIMIIYFYSKWDFCGQFTCRGHTHSAQCVKLLFLRAVEEYER